MTLTEWFRRVFSSGGAEEDAAEHEEFGLPDRDEIPHPSGGFAGQEGADAANADLDSFKPPADPDP